MSAIIPVFIPHAGCPHDCVFCNQKKIAGTLSVPNGDEVCSVIENALEFAGDKPQVAFYGGSFTAIPLSQMIEYLSVAKSFLEKGKISSVRLSTRPDAIDEERLLILKAYGVDTIELGTQSMSDYVLEKSGRGHTSRDTVNAVGLIKLHGFKLILQMMTHLPGSDSKKDIETAYAIAKLCPDGVRIYPTVVIRDTALETMWRAGKYTPVSPVDAAELGSILLDIFEEKNIPVIRFGLNPTDDLSAGEALCGAYHPALGEMAQSARYLRACCRKIEDERISGGSIKIFVNPRRVSAVVGQKKKNKQELVRRYGFQNISVCGDKKMPDGEIKIERTAN